MKKILSSLVMLSFVLSNVGAFPLIVIAQEVVQENEVSVETENIVVEETTEETSPSEETITDNNEAVPEVTEETSEENTNVTQIENEDNKINVCHQTDGENPSWRAIRINEEDRRAHREHGDFLYEGPTTPNESARNAWCRENTPNSEEPEPDPEEREEISTPIEVETSIVKVCKEDEAGNPLPGWTMKLNDGLSAGPELDFSGITGEDGCVTFPNIPYSTREVHEVMQEGWENVSGTGDVVVDEPTETFVVVNKLKEKACDAFDGRVFSNADTKVDNGDSPVTFAVLLSPTHPAWDADVDGAATVAKWIWSENPVSLPDTQVDTTKTFVRTFNIAGTPTEGTLRIAADNFYTVWVNGNEVGSELLDENNFQLATQDTYDVSSFLVAGSNEIKIDTTNKGVPGSDPLSNPAGVMFALRFEGEDCGEEEPEDGTLIVKKVIVGDQEALPTSFSFIVNDGATTAFEADAQNDLSLDAGIYTIVEDTAVGYITTYDNCTAVDLSPGETETCTITNTFDEGGGEPTTGHIIVDKITVPADDPQSFNFTTGGVGYNSFSLNDLASPNDQTLNPGLYSVSEELVAGWNSNGGVCVSSNEDTETPASISLQAGETVTCTFTNTQIVVDLPECSDTEDNDGDEFIDFPNDTGCTNENDNDETNEIPLSGGGGGGGGENISDNGGGVSSSSSRLRNGSSGSNNTNPQGQVLGVETTSSCGIYNTFLRRGYEGNNPISTKTVQEFLNNYMQAGLVVDGIFGKKTEEAVKLFQIKHADKILAPWNLTLPTGIFYITTQTTMNNIVCPGLNLTIPYPLIPFSSNKRTP